ncbi:hypothetical protein ABVK62_04995 [Bacillus subtilis]
MDKLKVNEEQIISDFECNINTSFFTENQFNLGSINTKTYVITLASKLPSSFISGAKVNLKNVLKNSSRNEFHHIFPKNHLKDLGKTNKEINVLANLCFLNNTDNQKIKDKAPAVYQDLLPKDRIKEILESHLCPSDTFNLTYEQFIQKRSELLKLYALELIK